MKYLEKPVAYLQSSDFNSNGNLINPDIPNDIPVLLMIQANYCGHCTNAKPAFQSVANSTDDIFCATIQMDGDEPGEKEIGAIVKKIDPKFSGFPDYVVYKNGKMVANYTGDRSVQDLKKFITSL